MITTTPFTKVHILKLNAEGKAEIKCIDIIVGDMSDDLKKKMKDKIPDDPSKTMGIYNVVLIAVGAKYDLTANVNVTDGRTNGLHQMR